MLSSLTADDLFAYIVMLRNGDSRTFVLVEGESDCALIDSHLTADSETLPATAKGIAIGAAVLAHENGVEGVIALVDRDFVGSLESPCPAPNVVYTDAYDLETTLFELRPVRTRVMNSYCKKVFRTGTLGASALADAANLALKSASAVAAFRYCSIQNGWGIGVRMFPIHVIVDLNDGEPDIDRLCLIALSKARSSLDLKMTAALVRERYPWMLARPDYCSGHDLMNALSYVINSKFGGSTGHDGLSAAFRAATSCNDLGKTRFFGQLRDFGIAIEKPVWACPACV